MNRRILTKAFRGDKRLDALSALRHGIVILRPGTFSAWTACRITSMTWSCEPTPPRETDTATRHRIFQPDRDQAFILVFRREGAAGHDGDAEPRDHHLPDGFQRVSLPASRIRATKFGAGIEHLLSETMSGMRQEDLLRNELPGIERFLFLPRVSGRDYRLKGFIIQGGREYPRFLEGKGDHDDISVPLFSIPARFWVRFSSNSRVQAAAGVARQAGKPMVAFSSDASVAARGVYLLSFLVQEEVERIVSFAEAAKGRRSVAALIPETTYGSVVDAAFREAAARHGLRVVAIERYSSGGAATAVRRLAGVIRSTGPRRMSCSFPTPAMASRPFPRRSRASVSIRSASSRWGPESGTNRASSRCPPFRAAGSRRRTLAASRPSRPRYGPASTRIRPGSPPCPTMP